MNYRIEGAPFTAVICKLENGETMECQKGAMAWMTPNIAMKTTTGGGLGKMLSRAVSGESMFKNKYTCSGGAGEIAFTTSVPGNVVPYEISAGNEIVAQKSAYLCSTEGVEMSVFFQKKVGAGFFGGEGFIMQKISGNGTAFLEFDGSIIEYDLAAGESMLLDTGYLGAMTATCSVDIVSVGGGIGNALFGGEGLFHTKVTGPGHIWIQTMPIPTFASSIEPFISRGSN